MLPERTRLYKHKLPAHMTGVHKTYILLKLYLEVQVS